MNPGGARTPAPRQPAAAKDGTIAGASELIDVTACGVELILASQ